MDSAREEARKWPEWMKGSRVNRREPLRGGYSFSLEIHEIAKNYLSYRLDYGEGVTCGALSLDGILKTFIETVKGVMNEG